MATKKPYRKIYGGGTVGTADSVAAIPLDYNYIQSLQNQLVSPGDYYGQEAQVGSNTVSPLTTETIPTDLSAPPEKPKLLNPVQLMLNQIDREKVLYDVPEYGASSGYKRDTRNSLIGGGILALLGGGVNPAVLPSYLDSAFDGVDRNEQRRVAQGQQAYRTKIKDAAQRYDDSVDAQGREIKANDIYNTGIAAVNRTGADVYGTGMTGYSAETRAKNTAKKNAVDALLKQYNPTLQALLTARDKNLTPDAIAKLTADANQFRSMLSILDVAPNDPLLPPEIQGTRFDELTTSLKSKEQEGVLNRQAAQKRTDTIVKYGLSGLQKRLDAAGEENEKDRRLRLDLAAQDDKFRRDKLEVDSYADKTKTDQDWQKHLDTIKVSPGSGTGQKLTGIRQEINQQNDNFTKYTQDIIKFRTYVEGSDANHVDENDQWKTNADRDRFYELTKNRDDTLKKLRDLDAKRKSVESKAERIASSVTTTQSVTTGRKATVPVTTSRSAARKLSTTDTAATTRRRPAAGAEKKPLVIPTKKRTAPTAGRKVNSNSGYTDRVSSSGVKYKVRFR